MRMRVLLVRPPVRTRKRARAHTHTHIAHIAHIAHTHAHYSWCAGRIRAFSEQSTERRTQRQHTSAPRSRQKPAAGSVGSLPPAFGGFRRQWPTGMADGCCCRSAPLRRRRAAAASHQVRCCLTLRRHAAQRLALVLLPCVTRAACDVRMERCACVCVCAFRSVLARACTSVLARACSLQRLRGPQRERRRQHSVGHGRRQHSVSHVRRGRPRAAASHPIRTEADAVGDHPFEP